MILNIDGELNRYYIQTLCMVFFPGATFGKNEEPADGVPEVSVSTFVDESGARFAYASMKLNDRQCEATVAVPDEDEATIATPTNLAVGRAMFAAGKELLGHIPPWGILTGVRPAKVAGSLLSAGRGVVKAKKILHDEFFLNPQKAALAVSVASTEHKLLKKLEPNTCSIYISIPFCPSRCSYCSFVSYTTPRLLSMIDDYVDALITELDETLALTKELGFRVSTVYIGGGTPTTLSAEQLEMIFSKLEEHIDVSGLDEFTLEAGRPDTITEEKLAVARAHGVTRVSVNPQTLNDTILREIGRRHTTDDFYRAYDIAKRSGIRDINVDLIAGLPGDDFANFSETIDKVLELRPSNITVHTFCVKKASDALRNNSGIYSLSGGDAAKCITYSQLNTKFAGYKPYYMYRQKNTVGNLENVGYALEGHEGLYNIYMMEEVQTIFAVGAGAVTKLVRKKHDGELEMKRMFKPKYPYEYLRDINGDESEGGDAAGVSEAKNSRRNEVLEFFSKTKAD